MSTRHIFWNTEERMRAGWRIAAQVIGWFVLLLVGQLLVSSLFSSITGGLSTAGPITRQIAAFVLQLMMPVAVFVTVWLAGRHLDRRHFADFGLHFNDKWWGDLGFGLFLGALLMTLIFLVERALGWVDVTGYFVARQGGLSFFPGLILPLITYIGVGISEELWNRGYILTNLAEGFQGKRFGPTAAIGLAAVLQGIFFALLHANNPHADWVSTLGIALISLLFGLSYILTGELALPIGLHITWNFFQGNVFGFPVSGTGFSVGTFIATEQSGPALWTGGPFGPEAGLMGVAALIVGSLLILLWVRLYHGDVTLNQAIAEAPAPTTRQSESGFPHPEIEH